MCHLFLLGRPFFPNFALQAKLSVTAIACTTRIGNSKPYVSVQIVVTVFVVA